MQAPLPDDHHCPWRELAESMERRFGAIIAEQQRIIEKQAAMIAELERRLGERDAAHAAEVAALTAEVQRLERTLIGRKSEKLDVPTPEREHDLAEPPSDDELARRRREGERKRRERALAKGATLETEEVTHPVAEDQKHCPKCGGTKFGHVGYETSTTVEYVPGRFVRRRIRREKVACECRECVLTAPAPPKLIEGGHYGPGFAAYLVVAKCADSIPIYRLEKRFARMGIPMARSTMTDLVHALAELLRPLHVRLMARMSQLEIVLADETSVRLQDRTKRGFIWVFSGRDESSGGELVLYVFATDRSGETPAKILGGTGGALVVDGYTGYNAVTDPEQRARGGCWSHARRKYFEAQSSAPEETKYVLDEIRKLFRVEHEAMVRGIVRTDAHLALRREKMKPVIDALFAWLVEKQASVLPKSPLGAAIRYTLNQRERLELCLSDARIPIHNNTSEERLRVVALGRKNYLFFGHPRAGRNFAGLYSLVGSCIANGVEPTAYLSDVALRVRDATSDDDLDALLPDRWSPAARA